MTGSGPCERFWPIPRGEPGWAPRVATTRSLITVLDKSPPRLPRHCTSPRPTGQECADGSSRSRRAWYGAARPRPLMAPLHPDGQTVTATFDLYRHGCPGLRNPATIGVSYTVNEADVERWSGSSNTTRQRRMDWRARSQAPSRAGSRIQPRVRTYEAAWRLVHWLAQLLRASPV